MKCKYNAIIKIDCVIGVNKGYFHNNENKIEFNTFIHSKINQFMNDKNEFLSFEVFESSVIYPSALGCPDGGEDVYHISATPNPLFDDINIAKNRVLNFIKELKNDLKQATVSVTIQDAEFYYFN